jgi:hypothetical protein
MRDCERRLRYLREARGHLDAMLALFDPDGNPKAIKAKRPYKHVKLFASGKLNRLILDALRKAERALTTTKVIEAIVADFGYGPEAAKGMKSRVRRGLLYLYKVRWSVVEEGERATATRRILGKTLNRDNFVASIKNQAISTICSTGLCYILTQASS